MKNMNQHCDYVGGCIDTILKQSTTSATSFTASQVKAMKIFLKKFWPFHKTRSEKLLEKVKLYENMRTRENNYNLEKTLAKSYTVIAIPSPRMMVLIPEKD